MREMNIKVTQIFKNVQKMGFHEVSKNAKKR